MAMSPSRPHGSTSSPVSSHTDLPSAFTTSPATLPFPLLQRIPLSSSLGPDGGFLASLKLDCASSKSGDGVHVQSMETMHIEVPLSVPGFAEVDSGPSALSCSHPGIAPVSPAPCVGPPCMPPHPMNPPSSTWAGAVMNNVDQLSTTLRTAASTCYSICLLSWSLFLLVPCMAVVQMLMGDCPYMILDLLLLGSSSSSTIRSREGCCCGDGVAGRR
ncbi:hypothetical protein Nepgr_033859 [Nepenthes gracilis]|uniref:Uncharacterized protein n=1 Tax=Nepenthes gracilis TaxID=150966 RepID=A0AAD3TL66_NEPGR|nr:hypothetical protein Nepgr_033859 [Nepenthes gracilis]